MWQKEKMRELPLQSTQLCPAHWLPICSSKDFSERWVNLPLLPTRLFSLQLLHPPLQPLHPKFSSHISFSERLLFCIFFLLFPREQLPDTSVLPLVFSEAGNTVQIPSFPPFLPFCSSFHSTHPLIISVYFSWFSVPLHFSYRHTSLSELIRKNSLEIALSICEFCFLWSLFSDIAFISICTPAQLILQSTDLVLELWYN